MRCPECEELIPDYLQHSLDPEPLRAVDQHLEQCSDCREQVAVWKKLAQLPEERPSPALRTRFQAMLAAYERGQEERERSRPSWSGAWKEIFTLRWFPAPLAQAALVLVLLALGFAAGRYVSALNTNAAELSSVRQELAGMRQLVVLSLLQQQSASERLQAVNWSMQANPNPAILSALLHTLRFDTSADVRLAALDALKHYQDRPMVRTGLVDALQGQQSPLVQIALIDLLVELRERSAVQRLKEVELEQNLNPLVRQRVQWGIGQLTQG